MIMCAPIKYTYPVLKNQLKLKYHTSKLKSPFIVIKPLTHLNNQN